MREGLGEDVGVDPLRETPHEDCGVVRVHLPLRLQTRQHDAVAMVRPAPASVMSHKRRANKEEDKSGVGWGSPYPVASSPPATSASPAPTPEEHACRTHTL